VLSLRFRDWPATHRYDPSLRPTATGYAVVSPGLLDAGVALIRLEGESVASVESLSPKSDITVADLSPTGEWLTVTSQDNGPLSVISSSMTKPFSASHRTPGSSV